MSALTEEPIAPEVCDKCGSYPCVCGTQPLRPCECPCEVCGKHPCACERKPRKTKVKLADGKERSIQHMTATSFWHPDGTPMSAQQFMQALFGKLPEFFRDEDEWLPKELHDRMHRDAVAINQALRYEMNSVEFAIKDGVPYAIDFTNPAPDMHVEHLGERYFNIAVDWMVDYAVKAAKEGYKTRDRYHWSQLGGVAAK